MLVSRGIDYTVMIVFMLEAPCVTHMMPMGQVLLILVGLLQACEDQANAVVWRFLFLALETRRRLYVAFGHRPCQAADIVLEKPVFALQLVVI